jgi:hypothetical protein
MKIICPMCGKENEYSPAVGCLIKCAQCAEWFGEPTLPASEMIPCPICTGAVNPAAECCPFCSHPLQTQSAVKPAVKPFRVASVGKILAGMVLVLLGIGLLISALRQMDSDRRESEAFERQTLDLNRR